MAATQDSIELEETNPTYIVPEQKQINSIRRAIFIEDKNIRAQHTWLKYQDQIGLALFLGSLAIMSTTVYAYIIGQLAIYWTVPIIALAISILHEIEHDVIHELYFKNQPWVRHIMFLFIWVAKIGANPWWRKVNHLRHHKVSGQISDAEERLIGLGLPLGLKKLLITISPLFTTLVVFDVARDVNNSGSKPYFSIFWGYLVNLPILIPAQALFYALLFPSYFSDATNAFIWYYNVAIFFPNMLRQVSLQVISIGCHYYGDIPEKNVFYQNQILNHWAFLPMQLFCFNFGETHIIHHYVTRQPFYLRQMIASAVIEEMKRQGVRSNDLAIFLRAHRYGETKLEASENPAMAS